MAPGNQERQGPGRRQGDEECIAHEKRLGEVDNEVHKQSGWLKAAAGLLSIAVLSIGAFNGVILSKLTLIEAMLSDSKVIMAEHAKDIKSIDKRVCDIEERNKYIDQQSGLLGTRGGLNR